MKPNNIIEHYNKLSSEAFQDESSDNLDIYNELGIDKEDYLAFKLKFVKRLKIKIKAKSNRLKNQELLELALLKLKEIIDCRLGSTKEKLEALISKNYPQFQFRNLEKLDDDDIREALNEIDIIDFIEQIDKLDNVAH